ncbi:MAG: ABC transporter ATP-binding protein [Candidatus Eisenbacteria bacterium]
MEPRRIVSVAGLWKGYGASAAGDRPVLRELSLDIDEGSFGIVLGVSGSGKSTLLNLIGGMDRPSAGTIEVCGRRIERMTETGLARFRREQIGFVFQSYNLLPTLTALENVEAGLEIAGGWTRHAIHERAREYLHAVGLAGRAAAFPAQLSGGEQQRVAVARALAKHPPLVLADEPTGNLDHETAAEIWRLLRSLSERTGATFLVATHDVSATIATDRVFRLDGGNLSACPRPGRHGSSARDRVPAGAGGFTGTRAGSTARDVDGPIEVVA